MKKIEIKNIGKSYDKEYFDFLYNKIPFYKWYINKKNSVLENLLKKYVSKGNLLDIGCGDGNILFYFSKNFDVYGIDISKYIVNQVRAKHPNLKVRVCDIEKEKLPFKKKFDVIFMWNIVEHLKNPTAVLKKVKRYLKKGGYLVMHLPTINSIVSKIEYTIVWDLLAREKTHIFRPSISQFNNTLLSLGYKIIESYSGQFMPFALTKNRTIMYSTCQYLVIAKKV